MAGPFPGSRKRADGSVLSWQTAALPGNQLDLVPFFIQWGEGTPHPSATSPQGCELLEVAVKAPDPAVLQKLLKTVGVEVPVAGGEPGAMTFRLRCARGEITFPAKEPEVPKE